MRRIAGAALVGLILLLGAAQCGLLERRLVLSYVVPDGYTGYVLIRWECPGGEALPPAPFGWGERRMTVVFSGEGTACIADAIPENGFTIPGYLYGGFRYENGDLAPVILGGTRALQREQAGQQVEFVFTMASIGIGNGGILGDECSWEAFVVANFGVPGPARTAACDLIYVQANPAIPLTPGVPAGP